MRPGLRVLLSFLGLGLVIALVVPAAIGQSPGPANNILRNQFNIEKGQAQVQKWMAPVSQSVMYAVYEATGELDNRLAQATLMGGNPGPRPRLRVPASDNTTGCSNTFNGKFPNIRVNQDCSLRRQAEEVIAINPTNPKNLIAGQNDSRVGFNKCGYDFSFSNGRTWGDQVPPFYQFILGDGHTADACSDPTATFDSVGNAYIAGVLFDITSPASAFVVAKSNAPIGGAFFHSTAPGPWQEYTDVPLGVVANDNDPDVFNDKEFIVADNNPESPKANNVYATWTRFATTNEGVGGDSPIYFSQSTDGGATWSTGIPISGSNPTACTDFSGSADPNACDQDQGSHPVVGWDGTLYVSFGNGNTPDFGHNQVMMVTCPATADCTNPASWTAPVKVSDMFDYQPFGPDPVSGCPAGRQCLPPNGYRMDDFVEISTAVSRTGRVFVTFGDGRNIGESCNPLGDAATATPPCDNDVFYSYSDHGGATWSEAMKVSPAGSAQWQPWSAVTTNGKVLWIAYYDRSYGKCEFTGCNDITLAKVVTPDSGSPAISYYRITTSSMPNLVPANNPVQAGFLGDYMWVTVGKGGQPYIVWADTRGLSNTVEEDIYFAIGPRP